MKNLLALAALAAAVTAAVGVAVGSAASTASTTCGPATGNVITGTVDSVNVPAGVDCLIAGARVKGNVVVYPGGAVWVLTSTIDRSFLSNSARWTLISGQTVITGGAQITGTTGIPGNAPYNAICASTIGRSLLITGSKAPYEVGCVGVGNTISGDVLLTGNQAAFGVHSNRITGSLFCTGNTPGASASANTAKKRFGECVVQ